MTTQAGPAAATTSDVDPRGARYKWVALSNTTMAVLLAAIDGTIVLIAMPAIFRGIHLDPLEPSNTFYLLWMILGFLVVTSVLVVSLGRLGDLYGRVRMFNLGFVIYTAASLVLTVDPLDGRPGALWLIVFRVAQGVGAAFLVANSGAILTDAFPTNQRGLALGINNVSYIAGAFIGLLLGGLLAPVEWRLVFLISVPIGLFGTVWSYRKLHDLSPRQSARVDWAGNVTFAVGLTLVMIGITSGIQPYHGHPMSWASPRVLAELVVGVAFLAAFGIVESRVAEPMFRLPLFKIKAFTFGTLSTFLSAVSRGGLQFMLIIWLQGIWLPEHGYSFEQTPIWAGIYMLPLTTGFLIAGPISGSLSDRYGARPFATGGMLVAGSSFVLMLFLPVDFSYPYFALTLFLGGLGMGLFAAPNRAGVMNSLPAADRGAGGGMNSTFQNSAQVFSIGIFFTLMIVGLSTTLRTSLRAGLLAHDVGRSAAIHISTLPPVSVLFAAFLGYNPIQHLVGPTQLSRLTPANRRALTGNAYFPHLISGAFQTGLRYAFAFSALVCVAAAIASWSRGGRYVDERGFARPGG